MKHLLIAIVCICGSAALVSLGCSVANEAEPASEVICNGYFRDQYGRLIVVDSYGPSGVTWHWADRPHMEPEQTPYGPIRGFRDMVPDYPSECVGRKME